MAVVQKGDLISLAPQKAESTQITWQQDLVDHTKEFRVIPFSVKGKSGVGGTLFLESSYQDEFLKLCEKDNENAFGSGDSYKTKVTDRIQYGQDRSDDPTIRFLVYHNEKDNIFQHRFMATNAFASIMGKVEGYVGKIPTLGPLIKKVMEYAKAFIGDPLRDF
jgi:hypothetical protein